MSYPGYSSIFTNKNNNNDDGDDDDDGDDHDNANDKIIRISIAPYP